MQFAQAEVNNYKLATNPTAKTSVECKISKGNYVVSNSKPTIISALGTVPKPDFSEVRLIHDCSRPQGWAFNDCMDTHSFKFQTLDDAIKMLKPNYILAKIDFPPLNTVCTQNDG